MSDDYAKEVEAQEAPPLRNHELARIWTDEEGRLGMKVDIPEEARINLAADVVAFAYLVAKLGRVLNALVETAAKGILDRRTEN